MREIEIGYPFYFIGSYVGSTLCKRSEMWTTVYTYSVDRKANRKELRKWKQEDICEILFFILSVCELLT